MTNFVGNIVDDERAEQLGIGDYPFPESHVLTEELTYGNSNYHLYVEGVLRASWSIPIRADLLDEVLDPATYAAVAAQRPSEPSDGEEVEEAPAPPADDLEGAEEASSRPVYESEEENPKFDSDEGRVIDRRDREPVDLEPAQDEEKSEEEVEDPEILVGGTVGHVKHFLDLASEAGDTDYIERVLELEKEQKNRKSVVEHANWLLEKDD